MDILIALVLVALVVAVVIGYGSRFPEVEITDDLREAEVHAKHRP